MRWTQARTANSGMIVDGFGYLQQTNKNRTITASLTRWLGDIQAKCMRNE